MTNDALYCIQILTHDAFSDQALLQILHDNWPESIANYRLNGFTQSDKFTAEEIALPRKKGVQVVISVADGTVYSPIGGGISSSTTSISDVVGCDRWKKFCYDLEAQVLQLQKETASSFTRPVHLRLRIQKDAQRVIVVLAGGERGQPELRSLI